MRYVLARIKQESRDEAYRFYVTDALKALGGFDKRYADIMVAAGFIIVEWYCLT